MPVLLLALALALTADQPSGVDRRMEQRSYPVTGATAAEIHRSMEANGPRQGGRTFYGLTEFSMGYRYSTQEVGGECRPAEVEVQIGITVTLPEWERPAGSDPHLAREWRRFRRALERHEDGHVRLADQAAERLRLGLLGLRAPCGRLGDRARALADDLGEISAEQNISFDERTEHGVREGAVWTFQPD